MSKPEPPAASVLSEEERIRRSLAALGVDPKQVERAISRDEPVFDALVQAWRDLGRAPTVRDVMERTEPKLSHHLVRDSLLRLRASGRVLSTGYGVNVPVMPEGG